MLTPPLLDQLTVIDFETTGFNPEHEFVTEIAAVRLRHGEVTSTFSTLVNFGGVVPANITALTGITTEMCARGREPRHAFALLRNFIGTDTVVAHNAAFDLAYLNRSYQRYGATQPLASPFLCTALLAQWYAMGGPGGPADAKLGTLCAHFGIKHGQAHRALADVEATAKVLARLFFLAESHHQGWAGADGAEAFIEGRFINRFPAPYVPGRQAVYNCWLPDYAQQFEKGGLEV